MGDDTGTDGEAELGASRSAIILCQELALEATLDASPSTAVATDDSYTAAAPLSLPFPATLTATNSHQYASLRLEYQRASGTPVLWCEYLCEDASCSTGYVRDVCFEGPSPISGFDPEANVTGVTSVTLKVRSSRFLAIDEGGGVVPSGHGIVSATFSFVESPPCSSPCVGLDDDDACTVDQCVIENGVPTAVHTDMCHEHPLPRTPAVTVGAILDGLLAGDNPAQQPTPPLTAVDVEPERAAGITGQVLRHDGLPAAGATIVVAGHDEYGRTEVDGAGEFVMLVEGGGLLTIEVTSAGCLPVHRQVHPDWQGWARADDIVLTPVSPTGTEIDLSAISGIATAAGTEETDDAGTRQGTTFFKEGTTAVLEFADGTTAAATEPLVIRATEYTVGEDGPARMPAPLPPQTAYTYAVDLSVDGTTGVQFSHATDAQPVVYYLRATDFLQFPVGVDVPHGRYDRNKRAWVPEDDGRVIRVLSEAAQGPYAAVAEIDVTYHASGNGDGAADTVIDGYTLSLEERAKIAELYAPGDILWRVPVSHFSPKDLNWMFGPDSSCSTGECDDEPDEPISSGPGPDPCEKPGSIIECENQILGERLHIPGTGATLNYRSDRTPGNLAARVVSVPLTEGTVSPDLRRAHARLEVGGQVIEYTLECGLTGCAPDERVDLSWDGKDRFGRPLHGSQRATVTWTYVYPAVYFARPDPGVTRTWATWGAPGSTAGVDAVYGERKFTKTWKIDIGSWEASGHGLGGWTLSNVHAYDPMTRVVHYGDGTRRRVDAAAPRIRQITPTSWNVGDNRAAAMPDGTTVLVFNSGSMYQVARDGSFALVENVGVSSGFVADLQAAPDGTLFMVKNYRLYRRDAPGVWTVIVGNGSATMTCSGQLGTSTGLPQGAVIAVAADHTVYIGVPGYICRLGPDGRLTRVAGNGGTGNAGHNIAAATTGGAVQVKVAGGMALGPDGALYFTSDVGDSSAIRRIRADGIIEDVVGGSSNTNPIDCPSSCPTVTHTLERVRGLSFGADGTLFAAEQYGSGWFSNGRAHVVRSIKDGLIATIAGTAGTICYSGYYCGNGGPAAAAQLSELHGVSSFRDGAIAVTAQRVMLIEPELPGFAQGGYTIPSKDGSVVDVFDGAGRHIHTKDALTGATLTSIGYDLDGRIDFIDDRDGRRTDIAYTADSPLAGETLVTLTGPDGDISELVVDAAGWLRSLENAEGEAATMAHGATTGLLTWFQKPKNASTDRSEFEYDALGRLTIDRDPAEYVQTLDRVSEDHTGWSVEHVSATGVASTYEVTRANSGVRQRLVVAPSGLATDLTTQPGELHTTTRADGTVVRRWMAPDPRLGMLSPYVKKEEIVVPGQPTKKIIRERSRAGTTFVDLWDFTTITEKTWFNPTVDNPITTPNIARTFTKSSGVETTTTSGGRSSARALDAKSRLLSWTPTPYHPTTFTYDQSTGRLLSTLQSSGSAARTTAYAYGADGRVDQVTDPQLNVTEFDWDNAGRLLWEKRLMAAGTTDDEQTSYGYDDNGNLVGLTPPDLPTHDMPADARDLLVAYSPPGPDDTLDPRELWDSEYAFDADRRLDAIARPDGVYLDYVYGAPPVPPNPPTTDVGKLVKVDAGVDQLGRAWRNETSYDSAGRPQFLDGPRWSTDPPVQPLQDVQSVHLGYAGYLKTSEAFTGTVGGSYPGKAVGWDYNDRHLPATEAVAGAHQIAFTYDNDGLLTNSGELTIGRNTAGQVFCVWNTHAGSGNSMREWRNYDATFGELSSIEYRIGPTVNSCSTATEMYGTSLFRLDFVRDDLGRIDQKQESVDGGTLVAYDYSYDEAGRLIDVLKNGLAFEHYEYDKNGNRLVAKYGTNPDINATYDDQDRIVSHDVWTDIVYTTNGELVARLDTNGNGVELEYDPFGSLIAANVDGSATPNKYDTDAKGRRLQTTYGGNTVGRWIWRSQLQPVAELNAANDVVARYVYSDGVNVPDLVMAGTERWRLIKDHLGSVRMVVDVASGTVLRSLEFDAFGRVIASSASDLDIVPFGFAGGLWDSDTRLVRFGARDYDPETGRWTAKDPIRFDGGDTNIYAYVGNDPVNRTDPEGKWALAAGALYGAACASSAVLTAFHHWPEIGTDKEKHCFVSCFVNRCGGLAFPWVTAGAGIGWEYGVGWDDDSAEDIFADFTGIDGSYDLSRTCRDICDEPADLCP